MTNKEIMEKLQFYFTFSGKVSIENGLVSCTGNVTLNSEKKVTELPVKFKSVRGNFWCINNKLSKLVGAPPSVDGFFFCHQNQLTSLIGAPQIVGSDFHCFLNPLTSLAGAPQVARKVLLTYNTGLPLLPLLKITGCQEVKFFDDGYNFQYLSAILNRYLGTGTRGMLPCAMEMIKAGYGSNAKL